MNYPDNISLYNEELYEQFREIKKLYLKELQILNDMQTSTTKTFKAKEFIIEAKSQHDPLYLSKFYQDIEDYINNLPVGQRYVYSVYVPIPTEYGTLMTDIVEIYISHDGCTDISSLDEYKEQESKVDKLYKEIIALKDKCDNMFI